MSDETVDVVARGGQGNPGTRGDPIMFFDAKNGNGPYYHACGGVSAIRAWLDRQITTGGVSAPERALVERMLDDLTDDDIADAAYNGMLPPDWHKTKPKMPAADPRDGRQGKERP